MHQLSDNDIQLIKNGNAALLDVRTDAEVAQQTSQYASHWDVEKLKQGQIPTFIEQHMPIFVYCRRGIRAADAQHILQQNGYKDVKNVGGFNDLPPEIL